MEEKSTRRPRLTIKQTCGPIDPRLESDPHSVFHSREYFTRLMIDLALSATHLVCAHNFATVHMP